MTQRKIYLVPGFFGFSTIGAVNYFYRVKETLTAELKHRAMDAEIIECRTLPTGSIPARADKLLTQVIDSGGLEADELHFIGHSTGGLDVRLLLTPGVRLREGDWEDQVGERTRTALSLSTPHFGTPLANFFTTIQGRNVLRLLTVLATSRQGRHTIFLASQLTSLLAQLDDNLGRRNTLIDVLSERLLDRVTLDRSDPLWQFLERISHDQGAVVHLTPEGMHLFNAAVTDRENVRYLCAISAAPTPSIGRAARNIWAVNRATTYAIFTVLHTLAAQMHQAYPYPHPTSDLAATLSTYLPFAVDGTTNDGVVPTLSQLYGELATAMVADHLDVVGQFKDAGGESYADWLASGSGFSETHFRALWDSVARSIAS